MDEGKSPIEGGPSTHYEKFTIPSDNLSINCDASSSLVPMTFPTQDPGHFGYGASLDVRQFSDNISLMPEGPQQIVSHCCAQSENPLNFPGDIKFETASSYDTVPLPLDGNEVDLLSMYLELESSFSSALSFGLGENKQAILATPPPFPQTVNHAIAYKESLEIRHQPSQSSQLVAEPLQLRMKKCMSNDELANLLVVDPKRAKRIWANRQSAARSKKRKKCYITHLEQKVDTLQKETKILVSQFSLLQQEKFALARENDELKRQQENMEEKIKQLDATFISLVMEAERLKVTTSSEAYDN